MDRYAVDRGPAGVFHGTGSCRRPGRITARASALCSAAPPSDDCFRCVPNWSFWRWVARALGPGPGMPGAPGRPPGWRRRGCRRPSRQGVLPEVAGLPRGDVIKQVWFGPALEGCCGQHCVLNLGVWRPRKVRSGRNRSRSPAQGSGSARLAGHQFSASAARWRNTSPGKVLSRGCRGASGAACKSARALTVNVIGCQCSPRSAADDGSVARPRARVHPGGQAS
jgi:hypothetical protein